MQLLNSHNQVKYLVETAGELLDLLLDARKHYPTINKDDIRVIVLEALPMILPGFNEKLADFSKVKMIERGIDIRLKTAVTSFDGTEVTVKSLDEIPKNSVDESKISVIRTKTLIWTAGVTPVNTIKRSMFKTDKGKIIVNDFLEVPEAKLKIQKYSYPKMLQFLFFFQ